MKKVSLVIMSLVLTSALHADAFKIMGGANLLKYYQTPTAENFKWNYKVGFGIGGGFEIDLTDDAIFSVEADGFYIQKKGGRIEEGVLDQEAVFSLSALCIPVLFRARFKFDSPFYVFGGGAVSLILSHKYKMENGDVFQVDFKEEEMTKNIDFGLVLGCGFEIKINRFQEFFVETRYHQGFANILKNTDEYGAVKASAILIVVGLKTH
jgi:opacity protein-like surface antigen